jgi:plasmid stabilization system protein ParE
MPGASVAVHPAAHTELQGAYSWYLERNPAAAVAFLEEIDHAIEAISENPNRWPFYVEGTRRLVLRRFPFSVVYRELASTIMVVAFAHGRRRPGYWRNR